MTIKFIVTNSRRLGEARMRELNVRVPIITRTEQLMGIEIHDKAEVEWISNPDIDWPDGFFETYESRIR